MGGFFERHSAILSDLARSIECQRWWAASEQAQVF